MTTYELSLGSGSSTIDDLMTNARYGSFVAYGDGGRRCIGPEIAVEGCHLSISYDGEYTTITISYDFETFVLTEDMLNAHGFTVFRTKKGLLRSKDVSMIDVPVVPIDDDAEPGDTLELGGFETEAVIEEETLRAFGLDGTAIDVL